MQCNSPLALQGIEFVEYPTTQPLALGAFLQRAGFTPIARHRSREVMLYRQGVMNIIVNAAPDASFNAVRSVGARTSAMWRAAYEEGNNSLPGTSFV